MRRRTWPWRRSLIAACEHAQRQRAELNRINVFPVRNLRDAGEVDVAAANENAGAGTFLESIESFSEYIAAIGLAVAI